MKNGKNQAINMLKQEILNNNSGDLDALFQIGQTYEQSGDFQKAIENYEKVIKVDQNDVEVLYLIGRNYSDLDNIDKAIEYLEKAMKIDSTYKEVLDLLQKLKSQ